VENQDIIIVKGGLYSDVKKALKQWLDIYSNDLQDGLLFKLFKNGRGNHFIQVDDRLDNEKFFFLVNYLKYPEGIEYKTEVGGYTTGKEQNLLKAQKLFVYIPSDDNSFDNVFVVTDKNSHYKVEFDGNISACDDVVRYKTPDVTVSDNSEIIIVNREKIDKEKKENSVVKITRRFKIVSSIILIVYGINFLLQTLLYNDEFFDDSSAVLFFGVSLWFLFEEEMLRINKFYFRCFLISIGISVYSFVLNKFLVPEISVISLSMSFSPLFLLLIQWPLRRLYIYLFNREPKVDGHGKFADLVYSLMLGFALMVLPLILVDWLYN